MQVLAIGLLITSCFFLFHYLAHSFSRIMHRNPNPVAVVCRMIFYATMSAVFFILLLAVFDYMQIEWRKGWPWVSLYAGYLILIFLLDKTVLRKILERMDPRLDHIPRARIKIDRS